MDYELIFGVVAAIASCIVAGVLWFVAKRDSENYIEWIADGDWK